MNLSKFEIFMIVVNFLVIVVSSYELFGIWNNRNEIIYPSQTPIMITVNTTNLINGGFINTDNNTFIIKD